MIFAHVLSLGLAPIPWMQLFTAILILLAAAVLDRLVLAGWQRSLLRLSGSLPHGDPPWLDLGWSFAGFGLRLGLWLSALLWASSQVPTLQPLVGWFIRGAQKFAQSLLQFLTTPLLDVGNNTFSLSSLIFLILIALSVFLASHSISEWIKRRILVRMRLSRGNREAVAAVIGYFLAALSLIIVLQTVGIDLSSLAVLAGVLGLGFGFGLQHLASNFISGLTLLFEQPIKVGDFIEVDGLMGTVEHISIRSTLVRTQDCVFVIVPNNRFIEKNVVNWSYRDPESRIHIPVNVAYGSDTVLVTEALLSAARMEPRVLSSPPPKVWFKRFGENALEFELLVWINQPQEFEPIKSSLNFLIEQELQQRRLEIPFPQRDLRIRNLDELGQILGKSLGLEQSHVPVSGAVTKPLHSVESPPAPTLTKNRNLRFLLRRVVYFEHCTDTELRVLIEQGYQKFFPAETVICRENDPGEAFYMILCGSVEVFSEKLGQAIAKLGTGGFFGEISLLTGLPRSATVRSLEDTVLFVVDRNALQKLLQDHRELAEQIALELSQRQQVLRELGLLDSEAITDPEATPLLWIRRHLQSLFGI